MKQLSIARLELPQLLDRDNLVGINLGVGRGEFSAKLWQTGRFAELWGVDCYERHNDTADYLDALKNVGFDANYRLLRMYFDDALNLFPDQHFDFVYIDGNARTVAQAAKPLYDWLLKVKLGGMIAGCKYHPEWPQLMNSVDRFTVDAGIDLMVTQLLEERGSYEEFPSWAGYRTSIQAVAFPDSMQREAEHMANEEATKLRKHQQAALLPADAGIREARRLKRIIRKKRHQIRDPLSPELTAPLAKLRGRARGKRCLILGSAPSVHELDLAALVECDVFALNKAATLVSDFSPGRRMLVLSDPQAIDAYGDVLPLRQMDELYLSADVQKIQHPKQYRFEYFKRPTCFQGYAQRKLGKPLYHCHTVASFALQLAVGMGYKEIYLAGVDLTFDEDQSHFYAASEGEMQRSAQVSRPKGPRMRAGLAYLAHWASKRGSRVINLSPKRSLPLIENRDYVSVFPTR